MRPQGVRDRVRTLLFRFARTRLKAAGFDLVRQDFYSPLPDFDRLAGTPWDTPSQSVGVDLGVDRGMNLLNTALRPYLSEFNPPRQPDAPGGFFLENQSYGPVDAEILYTMIRHAKPGQVLEFGSGASSHVIAAAAEANASEGAPLVHRIYDPFPFTASPMAPIQGVKVHRVRAEELDAEFVAGQMNDGDILFVDTTHTVKTGGDVTWLFLELLPQIPIGALAHIHDVFLPYEYPKDWVVTQRHAWAEQYLLHAFLSFNHAFEVVLPAYALSRRFPQHLSDLVPSYESGVMPAAFWVRRNA